MISSTEGPSALSARRLATQSGTTTAAIYTLFGGMNSLRAALTAQSLQGLGEALTGAGSDDDPIERLRAMASAYRTWALENPHEYRSVFTDALGLAVRGTMEPPRAEEAADSFTAPGVYLDSVHDAWHAALAPLSQTLRDGLASGTFRGEQELAGALAMSVLSLLHGAVSLELVGVLDTTLAGLGSSASTTEFFDGAVARLVLGLAEDPAAVAARGTGA